MFSSSLLIQPCNILHYVFNGKFETNLTHHSCDKYEVLTRLTKVDRVRNYDQVQQLLIIMGGNLFMNVFQNRKEGLCRRILLKRNTSNDYPDFKCEL